MIKIDNGRLIVNVSYGMANYGQRNNEFVWKLNSTAKNAKINKGTMCNFTSICMGLSYVGYRFPIDKNYSQPEDAAANFFVNNPAIDKYYKEHMPALYDAYIKDEKGCYTPNELHQILAYGINLWLGCNAVNFSTERKISDIIKELFYERPVVISGIFEGLNHITCLVGAVFNLNGITDINEATKKALDGTLPVSYWIMDDPWGNIHEANYKSGASGTGNDILMQNEYFIKNVKPINNNIIKWGHFFNPPAARV